MTRKTVLSSLFFLLLVACGGAGGSGDSIATAPSATWSTGLLGQAPDVALHLRVGELLADTRYGRATQSAIGELGRNAGTLEDFPVIGIDDPRFYASCVVDVMTSFGPSLDDFRSYRSIVILRGVPNFDPRAVHLRNGEAALGPGVRTFPSGVTEFLSAPQRPRRFALYVMPDRATWVVTDDVTAQRAGPYFWSNGAAPPASTDDGALATVAVGARALGLLTQLLQHRNESQRGLTGMQSATLSLRPSREGTITAQVAFDADANADALAVMLDRTRPCPDRPCTEAHQIVSEVLPTVVTREGRNVRTTTTLTDKIMRKLAE